LELDNVGTHEPVSHGESRARTRSHPLTQSCVEGLDLRDEGVEFQREARKWWRGVVASRATTGRDEFARRCVAFLHFKDFGDEAVVGLLQFNDVAGDFLEAAERLVPIEVAVETDFVADLGLFEVDPSVFNVGAHLAEEVGVDLVLEWDGLGIAEVGVGLVEEKFAGLVRRVVSVVDELVFGAGEAGAESGEFLGGEFEPF